MRRLGIMIAMMSTLLCLLWAGQVDYFLYTGNTFKFTKVDADTIEVGVIDTLGAYLDTTALDTLGAYVDTTMWFAGQDTFGDEATTDTVVIDTGSISITGVVISILASDPANAYLTSVSTAAGTVFVHRAEADTNKSDVYYYIGKRE